MSAPVSVIIPCYCCEKTIERAVESVAQQTHLPTEVLLIEDGSPDGTLMVLKRLEKSYPQNWIKVISLGKNCGVSVARNRGWDEATQPYIAFLDADDLWHPRKIELQYQWLRKHPEIDGCGHNYVNLNEENIQFLDLEESFSNRVISKQEILSANPLVTSSLMLKRAIAYAYRFEPSQSYCEDHNLLLNLILDDHSIAYLDIPALLYDDLTPGLSANKWKMRKAQLRIYWRLWQEKKINVFAYVLCSVYSLSKFIIYLIMPKFHFFMHSVMSRKTLKKGIQNP